MDEDIEMEDLNQKEDNPKKEELTIKIHKKWKYSIKEKLYFVGLALKKGKNYVSKIYNIDRKSLSEWEREEPILKQ